jgi:hypothetical protein
MRGFLVTGVDHDCESLITPKPGRSDEEIADDIRQIEADGRHKVEPVEFETIEFDLSTLIPELVSRILGPDPIMDKTKGQKHLYN